MPPRAINGIESATLKVKRAREHLQELELCSSRYTRNKTNLVVDDSEGTKKLRFPNDPPTEIAILAGEVVYHLRSALDHLAFELVKRNATGSILPKSWETNCEFPLNLEIPTYGNPKVQRTIPLAFNLFKKSLPGITPEAFAVIEQLQPYNGGNGPTQLGWLAKLANVDKHRHFHILVPQAYQTEHIRSALLDSEVIECIQDGAEMKFPLHGPEELLDAVYVDCGVAFPFVSFNEGVLSEDLKDIPIDNILARCADAVEYNVIPKFAALI